MDCEEPRRADLTTQRDAAAAKLWAFPVGSKEWDCVVSCTLKVRRANRRKLLYIITPEGLALRARLTLDYINTSFHLYRLVRERMHEALGQVRAHGYHQVRLEGSGDVAEVCRLTCLEQGISVVTAPEAPLLLVNGMKVFVTLPDGGGQAGPSAEITPESSETKGED